MVTRIARHRITIVIPKHFKVDHEKVQTLDDAYVKIRALQPTHSR